MNLHNALRLALHEHARRVAIAEIVSVAELASASGKDAIKAFGVLVLRRAVKIAEGSSTAHVYTEHDIENFLAWWKTPPTSSKKIAARSAGAAAEKKHPPHGRKKNR